MNKRFKVKEGLAMKRIYKQPNMKVCVFETEVITASTVVLGTDNIGSLPSDWTFDGVFSGGAL